jgi:hypothetical protein
MVRYDDERLVRIAIRTPPAPLPRGWRKGLRRRWRGRLEIRRFRDADVTVLSRAKSGRTWLRAMLTRLYQARYGLPENELLEFDNFHRRDRRIPKILFTHGHAIGELFDAGLVDRELGQRSLVFLARHPCDVAVSEYFQSTRRARRYKRELYGVDEDPEMFEFVMRGSLGLPAIVEYLNAWERRIEGRPSVLRVRYEDMRADPVESLERVVTSLGESFTRQEIADAVEFASFERLKERERENFFASHRLAPRDPDDPDSYKVRRGKVGGYRDYFRVEEIERMEALLAERLSPRYGYVADPPAESPPPLR